MFNAGVTRAGAASLVLKHLRDAGVDTPETDARILMMHATGLAQLELITRPAVPLSAVEIASLEALVMRRLQGTPVARLIGHRDFWGMPFRLSPDTLEPRPDSETIIEEALDRVREQAAPPVRILDLGTGSGCLLVALLSEMPDAHGVGTDINAGALLIAAANAASNNVASRARFEQRSWGDGLAGGFDLVVSNPPYIESGALGGLSREVREHDPARALDGGHDGLDAYRVILAELPRLLNRGATAVLEIGAGQEAGLRALAFRHGLGVAGTRRDLGGHVRAISLRSLAEN